MNSNVNLVYEISKTFLQRSEKVKVNIKTLVCQEKGFSQANQPAFKHQLHTLVYKQRTVLFNSGSVFFKFLMNLALNVAVFVLLNTYRYHTTDTIFKLSVFMPVFTPRSFYVLLITIFFYCQFHFPHSQPYNLIKTDTLAFLLISQNTPYLFYFQSKKKQHF